MDDVAAVERIFEISDHNKDGALNKDELSWLIKAVNKDALLSEGQLGLVLDELWTDYAAHVVPEGLTSQGLVQLYVDGFADPQQDYHCLVAESSLGSDAEDVQPVASPGSAATAVQFEAGGAAVTTKRLRLPAGTPAAAAAGGAAALSTPTSARTAAFGAAGDVDVGASTPMATTPVTAKSGMLSRTFTPCSDVFEGLITPKVYAAAAGFFEGGLSRRNSLGLGEEKEGQGAGLHAAILASPETTGLLSAQCYNMPGSPSALSAGGDVFDGVVTPGLDAAQGWEPPSSLPTILTASRGMGFAPAPGADQGLGATAGAGLGVAARQESVQGSYLDTPMSPDVFDGLNTPQGAAAGGSARASASRAAANAAASQQPQPSLSRASSSVSQQAGGWGAPSWAGSQPATPMSDVFDGMLTPKSEWGPDLCGQGQGLALASAGLAGGLAVGTAAAGMGMGTAAGAPGAAHMSPCPPPFSAPAASAAAMMVDEEGEGSISLAGDGSSPSALGPLSVTKPAAAGASPIGAAASISFAMGGTPTSIPGPASVSKSAAAGESPAGAAASISFAMGGTPISIPGPASVSKSAAAGESPAGAAASISFAMAGTPSSIPGPPSVSKSAAAGESPAASVSLARASTPTTIPGPPSLGKPTQGAVEGVSPGTGATASPPTIAPPALELPSPGLSAGSHTPPMPWKAPALSDGHTTPAASLQGVAAQQAHRAASPPRGSPSPAMLCLPTSVGTMTGSVPVPAEASPQPATRASLAVSPRAAAATSPAATALSPRVEAGTSPSAAAPSPASGSAIASAAAVASGAVAMSGIMLGGATPSPPAATTPAAAAPAAGGGSLATPLVPNTQTEASPVSPGLSQASQASAASPAAPSAVTAVGAGAASPAAATPTSHVSIMQLAGTQPAAAVASPPCAGDLVVAEAGASAGMSGRSWEASPAASSMQGIAAATIPSSIPAAHTPASLAGAWEGSLDGEDTTSQGHGFRLDATALMEASESVADIDTGGMTPASVSKPLQRSAAAPTPASVHTSGDVSMAEATQESFNSAAPLAEAAEQVPGGGTVEQFVVAERARQGRKGAKLADAPMVDADLAPAGLADACMEDAEQAAPASPSVQASVAFSPSAADQAATGLAMGTAAAVHVSPLLQQSPAEATGSAGTASLVGATAYSPEPARSPAGSLQVPSSTPGMTPYNVPQAQLSISRAAAALEGPAAAGATPLGYLAEPGSPAVPATQLAAAGASPSASPTYSAAGLPSPQPTVPSPAAVAASPTAAQLSPGLGTSSPAVPHAVSTTAALSSPAAGTPTAASPSPLATSSPAGPGIVSSALQSPAVAATPVGAFGASASSAAPATCPAAAPANPALGPPSPTATASSPAALAGNVVAMQLSLAATPPQASITGASNNQENLAGPASHSSPAQPVGSPSNAVLSAAIGGGAAVVGGAAWLASSVSAPAAASPAALQVPASAPLTSPAPAAAVAAATLPASPPTAPTAAPAFGSAGPPSATPAASPGAAGLSLAIAAMSPIHAATSQAEAGSASSPGPSVSFLAVQATSPQGGASPMNAGFTATPASMGRAAASPAPVMASPPTATVASAAKEHAVSPAASTPGVATQPASPHSAVVARPQAGASPMQAGLTAGSPVAAASSPSTAAMSPPACAAAAPTAAMHSCFSAVTSPTSPATSSLAVTSPAANSPATNIPAISSPPVRSSTFVVAGAASSPSWQAQPAAGIPPALSVAQPLELASSPELQPAGIVPAAMRAAAVPSEREAVEAELVVAGEVPACEMVVEEFVAAQHAQRSHRPARLASAHLAHPPMDATAAEAAGSPAQPVAAAMATGRTSPAGSAAAPSTAPTPSLAGLASPAAAPIPTPAAAATPEAQPPPSSTAALQLSPAQPLESGAPTPAATLPSSQATHLAERSPAWFSPSTSCGVPGATPGADTAQSPTASATTTAWQSPQASLATALVSPAAAEASLLASTAKAGPHTVPSPAAAWEASPCEGPPAAAAAAAATKPASPAAAPQLPQSPASSAAWGSSTAHAGVLSAYSSPADHASSAAASPTLPAAALPASDTAVPSSAGGVPALPELASGGEASSPAPPSSGMQAQAATHGQAGDARSSDGAAVGMAAVGLGMGGAAAVVAAAASTSVSKPPAPSHQADWPMPAGLPPHSWPLLTASPLSSAVSSPMSVGVPGSVGMEAASAAPGSSQQSGKKGTNGIFKKFRSLLGRRNAGASATPLQPAADAAAPPQSQQSPAQDLSDTPGMAAAAAALAAGGVVAAAVAVGLQAEPDVVLPEEEVAAGMSEAPQPASAPQQHTLPSPAAHHGGTIPAAVAAERGASIPSVGADRSAGSSLSMGAGAADADASPSAPFVARSPTISLAEQQLAAAKAGVSLMEVAPAGRAHVPSSHAEQAPGQGLVEGTAQQAAAAGNASPSSGGDLATRAGLEAGLAALDLSGQQQQQQEEDVAHEEDESIFHTAVNLAARMEQAAREAGMAPSPGVALEAEYPYKSLRASPSSAGSEEALEEGLLPSPARPQFGEGFNTAQDGSPLLLWVPDNKQPAAAPTPAFGFATAQAPAEQQPSSSSIFSFGGAGARPTPESVGGPTPGLTFAPAPASSDAPTPLLFAPGEASPSAAESLDRDASLPAHRAADAVLGAAAAGMVAAGAAVHSSSVTAGKAAQQCAPRLAPLALSPLAEGLSMSSPAGVAGVSLRSMGDAGLVSPLAAGAALHSPAASVRTAASPASTRGEVEAAADSGDAAWRSLEEAALSSPLAVGAAAHSPAGSAGGPPSARLASSAAVGTALPSPAGSAGSTRSGRQASPYSREAAAAHSPAGSAGRAPSAALASPASTAGMEARRMGDPAAAAGFASPLVVEAAAPSPGGSEARSPGLVSPLASGAVGFIPADAPAGSPSARPTAKSGLSSGPLMDRASSAFGAMPQGVPERVAWDDKPPEEVEAYIQGLLSSLDTILSAPPVNTADIMGVQGEASQLPGWASHKAHMDIGMRLNQKQRHYEALRSFQVALTTEPEDPLAHFRMGNAFFALKKYPEARKVFLMALKCCQPEQDDALKPKIYVNLGITQEAEGLLMSACDYYREVTAINPTHFRAHKLLGSALYALGDFKGAAGALKEALKLKPDYADAYCDLGCTYCAMGEVDQAKRCFSSALQHNPHHLEAHFNKGNLYRQLAEFQRAIASYDAVLAVDPSHWRSLLNKAVVQTCTGDKQEAAFNLKLALKLSGQGSVLQQEIDQLKHMLKHGAKWEVISQMMSYISDKAAQVESSCLDDATPQSKATFGNFGNLTNKMMKSPLMGGSSSSKHSKSKLQRLGYDISKVVQTVDVPMLQQLQPLTSARLADLQAEAVDDNISWTRKGKQIKVAKGEALLRRILSKTPPLLFQHMMRTMHSQVLAVLDYKGSGYVELSTLLMMLVAICDAPCMDRIQAAYQILEWGKKGVTITQADAREYVSALKVVFGINHDPSLFTSRAPDAFDGHFVNVHRFATIVTDVNNGFGCYEILPLLVKPLS